MKKVIIIYSVVFLWTCTCFSRDIKITGKVVDYTAHAVANAEVAVVENGKEPETQIEDAKICGPIVRTDERGLFEVKAEIQNLRDVFVVARKSGLALSWDKAPIMAEHAGTIHFNLVMEKTALLTGIVVDSSEKPIAQAKVCAMPKSCYTSTLSQSPFSLPQEWLSVHTDDAGRFKFDIFSADVSCDFLVQTKSHHCVYNFTTNHLSGCGYEVGRPDIRLVLPDEHPVRGHVIQQGTGTPVAGVELVISRPTERNDRNDIKNQYMRYRVRSDKDGRFVFPGVPEGDHQIDLVYPQDKVNEWAANPIGISLESEHAADDVTFEVDKGGLVEILARNAETREPLQGLIVSMTNLPFSRLPRTDSNGIASIRLLPNESRAFISSGFSPNDEYRSWNRENINKKYVIERGKTLRLEANLEPANRITGIVVDPDGKPVPGVMVRTHPLSTGGTFVTTSGDEFSADTNGHFSYACGESDPSTWYITAHCEERGLVGVTQVKGPDQPVQIMIEPGVTVKGIVTNEEGIGIPAAHVSVDVRLNGTVTNIKSQTLCDANGVFSIPGVLPPDEVTICWLVVDASGYGPKSYVEIKVSDQPGTVTDLGRITLMKADESIAGVVVDPNNQPVPNIFIILDSASREISQPRKMTATDENGRFRFERICKGPVSLQSGYMTDALYGTAKAEAGQQDVKILLRPGRQDSYITVGPGGTFVSVPASPKYNSLIGKPLNQVKGLESLSTKDGSAKPMLIIFMDQQQRPSRQSVLELSKRTDELNAKGITTIIAQVNKIERAYLNKWLEDENVKFESQILEEDFNLQQYSWGIKALPWLILTDKNHIVQAEGLSINELDEKINEMGAN